MSDAQQNGVARSSPTRNRRRLRSHLINHGVRLRLVLDDAVFALVAALAAIGILYYLGNRELGDSLFSAHLSIKETRELLNTGVKVAGIVTFAAVLLFGLWSLVDAHRIVGPMHRLNRILNEIGGGDLTHEIRFRRGDEFSELAAATDRMVHVYAARLTAIRQQAASIAHALNSDTLTADQIRDLRRQAAELTEQLTFFRLPTDGVQPAVDHTPLS
jgi:methyl-accepting chemotaxis protein